MRPNKYGGECDCGADVPPGDGYIHKPKGARRFTVLCKPCGQAEQRRLACVEDDRLAYYGSTERADFYSPSGW